MHTFHDAKTMAKTLRAEVLERTQVDLAHSQCLEIVSHQFGAHDWNTLAAAIESQPSTGSPTWRTSFAAATTIPVLRIFSEAEARKFYLDFLGFSLDFGGPAQGGDSPFYGQISRPGCTLQLTEHRYEPGPGATVDVWISGLDDFRDELITKDDGIFGPALGVPSIEATFWGARILTLRDPFGNNLRISEPAELSTDDHLPWWAEGSGAPSTS